MAWQLSQVWTMFRCNIMEITLHHTSHKYWMIAFEHGHVTTCNRQVCCCLKASCHLSTHCLQYSDLLSPMVIRLTNSMYISGCYHWTGCCSQSNCFIHRFVCTNQEKIQTKPSFRASHWTRNWLVKTNAVIASMYIHISVLITIVLLRGLTLSRKHCPTFLASCPHNRRASKRDLPAREESSSQNVTQSIIINTKGSLC